MAASITLNISVNSAKALTDIEAVNKAADAAAKTPHVINFTSNGANVVIKEAKQATTALAEAAAAEQRKLAATQNRAAAEARTSTARINALSKEQQAEARAELSAQKHAEKMEELAARTNQATSASNAFSVALGNIAARAVHAVINKATQAFKEALTTMKSVDSELANIQKVTDESDAVIAKLGDTAYDTASKYGVAANDFLSASADFAKAGYDNYSAMAELATKTQLVGDVSADVASKFLLSADAAFKFGGNIDSLSTVLDKANIIENNYATSIEKLADGFPVVANTAAMANMSIDETMAAIGTITAVTQESGPMAARALRALILNILKDTTTEVEDGVTVTTDQIKSLQDALNKYAPDVVKAAEATGKIIDPMEAIGALSKAWEEGLLSEQELAAMVTDIGGKLRTNQLLALIKNFDMFNEMLDKSKNSAGSADKEIGIMLDTWEAKTNILKNTWTKFVADIVDTDTIKGGIDFLTGIVDGLDSLVQKSKNPFYDSGKVNNEIEETESKISSLREEIERLGESGKFDQSALDNLNYELQVQEEILRVKQEQYRVEHKGEAEKLQQRLTQKNTDYVNYYNDWNDIPEWKRYADTEALGNLNNSIAGIQYENATQYQEALKGVASATKDYYDQVKLVQDVLGDGALTEAQKEFISTWEQVDSASSAEGLHIDGLVDGVDGLTDGYLRLVDAQGNVVAYTRNTLDVLKEQEDAYADQVRAEEEAQENRQQIIDDNRQAVSDFTELASQRGEEISGLFTSYLDNLTGFYEQFYQQADDASSGATDLETAEAGATSEAEATADAADSISFDSATSSAERLLGVIQAIDAGAHGISIGAFGAFGFATGTTNAPGGPTLVNELGPELISENGRAYIANGGRPGIVNLSHGAIVLPANVTEDALKGGRTTTKKIRAAAPGLGGSMVVDNGNPTPVKPTVAYGQVVVDGRNIANLGNGQNLIINTTSGSANVESTEPKRGTGKGSGGAAATAAAAKSIEDYAKETKDVLSNLEKQAKLADNRGQYSKEADLYKKAQSEIDKMVSRYKKAGYKETDDEILDLLNKRYDYDKKIDTANQKGIKEAADELKDKLSNLDKQAKLANTEGDYTKEVQFYEQAQELIAEMVDRYRKAGYADDSDEIVDLLQKNYDYGDKQVKVYSDRWKDLINALDADTEAQEVATKLAEKQQALEDARLALENAAKNRTVRMYNAATGKWEWVADQSKVNQAKENLTKAESDYTDTVKESAVSELENLAANNTRLEDAILGPALSAIMMKAESSPEFQNFARALNAVYGVGSYLNSTEGSSKVISTASDSHDTIYTFGNVTLTEAEAQSMSVAELAQKLQVLKIS